MRIFLDPDATEATGGATATAEPASEPVQDNSSNEIVDPADMNAAADDSIADDSQAGDANDATDDSQAGGEVANGLKQQALEYGFAEDEVANLSDEALQAAMTAFDRRIARMAQPEPQAQPVQQQTQQEPAQVRPESLEIKWSDDIDQEVVKNFTALQNHLVAMQQQMGSIQQAESQRRQQAAEQEFDTVLDSLPEYEAVLGRSDALKTGDEPFQNRAKVWETMRLLAAGYAKNGLNIPPVGELARRAVRAEFGGKAEELVRQKVAQSLDKKRRQVIGRSTLRRGTEALDPVTRGTRNVAAKLEAWGIGRVNENVEEI